MTPSAAPHPTLAERASPPGPLLLHPLSLHPPHPNPSDPPTLTCTSSGSVPHSLRRSAQCRSAAAAPPHPPADKGAMPAAEPNARSPPVRTDGPRGRRTGGGRCSVPLPGLSAAPAGPQPGCAPHLSVGLGRAGLGRAGAGGGVGWGARGGRTGSVPLSAPVLVPRTRPCSPHLPTVGAVSAAAVCRDGGNWLPGRRCQAVKKPLKGTGSISSPHSSLRVRQKAPSISRVQKARGLAAPVLPSPRSHRSSTSDTAESPHPLPLTPKPIPSSHRATH